MNLQFVNAWVLLFLWLIPAVGVWWYIVHQRRKKDLTRFISPTMLKKLHPAGSDARAAWQAALILGGLFFLLFAAARPQWGTQEVTVYQRGRDLMIALDVSRSMLADDVRPNRLQRAKMDLMDLIKDLRGDRAGLVAFRFKATLLCPLTADYAFLKHALDAVDIGSAPRGETNIGDAILKAIDSFDTQEGSHKAIILISDGEDLTGQALAAAKTAGEKGIPIFTVGLGSVQGSRIREEEGRSMFITHDGKEVISKLDNQSLLAVAEASKGAYVSIGTASTITTTLGALYRNYVQKIADQEIEETQQRRRVERFQIFLLPSVLLLLAGSFLSRGRLAASARGTPSISAPESAAPAAKLPVNGPRPLKDLTPPKRELKNISILVAWLLLLTSGSNAETNTAGVASTNAAPAAAAWAPADSDIPSGRDGARKAQRLFMLGMYEKAASAYLKAAQGASGRSQRDFKFNAAVALFKAGKYDESARVLRELELLSPETDADLSKALGSAFYRAACLRTQDDSTNLVERARLVKEAGEAFRGAARAETDNQDSLHNLAVTLDQIPDLEERAKIAKLLAQYQNTPAPELAGRLLAEQRQIIDGTAQALTNTSPQQIRALESLSDKQKAAADLWIPLKGKLLQALAQQGGGTNQNQIAMLNQMIENTRDNMQGASAKLRDLEPEALDAAVKSEAATYSLWRGVAPFDLILQEDLRVQTNAISRASGKLSSKSEPPAPLRPEQEEALNLTRLFAERFAQSVPETGLPAPPAQGPNQPGPMVQPPDGKDAGSTNKLISAENRKKILDLAGQTVAVQDKAAGLLKADDLPQALPLQNRAYELLKEIEKLLPKQQQNQQQEQEQQPQDNQQTEQQPQPKEQPEPEKKDQTPEDVKRLLEKALQREQEHEEKERKRQRAIPMSPRERDW